MHRLTERKVRVSDDTTYVTINDQTFYLFTQAQKDKMLSWSWMKDEHKNFEWITGDLYLYTDFSRGQLYKAINLGTFDYAVPQGWFEAHMEEIKSRGGVVWYYAEKDYVGKPYFDDNAMCALKTLIRQTLEENRE